MLGVEIDERERAKLYSPRNCPPKCEVIAAPRTDQLIFECAVAEVSHFHHSNHTRSEQTDRQAKQVPGYS